MRTLRRFLLPALVLLALAAAAAIAVRPAVVPVDVSEVREGSIEVTVDEDGRTRVKDRYVVFSPLAGRMDRIVLEAGDAIVAGQTTLAVIDPSDPALLDARAEAEAEARVRAAEAALQRAGQHRMAAVSALELARMELDDLREVMRREAGTKRELDEAEIRATMRQQEARAAEFAEQIATFELEQSRAALLRTRSADGSAAPWRFEIPSPITGRVLRVLRDSAGVVLPGTALLEIGDTSELEVEVDILSADAVRVPPGGRVILERWGGDRPLRGRVRVVEPSGFTKISSLGVEEQRVNVIIDFADPAEARTALGDGYRVDVRIVIDEADGVLVAPSGAFFRHSDGWATYVVAEGRAQRREVTLGRRGSLEVEVVAGLSQGDVVVLYPSDRVEDGVRVRVR